MPKGTPGTLPAPRLSVNSPSFLHSFQFRTHQATSFLAAGMTSPRAANRVITSEAKASMARAAADLA